MESNGDKKVFVLDTNVLVYDPKAVFKFGQHMVVIPFVVLLELDRFKSENTIRGKNSRQAIRHLDELREQASLRDGVALDSGGTLKIVLRDQAELKKMEECPQVVDSLSNDTEILTVAAEYQKKSPEVRLITKDINMRVRADALGIPVEDYSKEVIDEEAAYKGWVEIRVPAVALKKGMQEYLNHLVDENRLLLNEYVLVRSEHNEYNYKIFCYKGGKNFVPVDQPNLRWPIQGKNPQQIMALHALLDPDIQFVTLIGGAGTGKTFLALVAGLHEVLVDSLYERLLITRPVVPLGPDIGYLPGDVREKLHSWMQPIYDNMEFILHLVNQSQPAQQHISDGHKKDKRKDRAFTDHHQAALQSIDQLVHRNKVSLEAITYMRGRSIPYQYILIDEVQNLTPHEVKTLVTRVGQGSKIILTGDPYQIDSPYLDFGSNGLVVAAQHFKGEPYFASVFLTASERSPLSQRASELL